MGLGVKRICQSCSSKFYDLEKDPILCPKCGSTFDPEAAMKPKRGRRKATIVEEAEPEEIEVSLEDDADDLDDDAVAEELDEEIRDEMEMEDDESPLHEKKKGGKILVDLDDDDGDIIESDDTPDKE